MSLATSVAGSTLRPQQHAKAQQNCTKTPQIQTNNSSTITTSTQAAVNCVQQTVSASSPPTSIRASLSTSPIAANFMGSSLFSFESGVVLSGSSGCCSLSNSPSSSSSSNSYLTSQSLENTCNKLQATNGNQICLNSSTSLEDSFHSATCQLNASLLAAVNADFEDDHHHVMAKSLNDNSNQNKTNLHTSTDTLQNHNENSENGQQRTHLMENTHNQHQSSAADSSCLNNEDARALQLAVELTMINLNQMPSPTSIAAQRTLSPTSSISSHHYQQLHHHQPSFATVGNPYHMTTKVFLQTQSQAAGALINRTFLNDASNQDNIPVTSPNQNLPNVTPPTTTTEERSKKSQNMTECVPVPSSEHVAEIVGRQGCKIKALRAKTNTYIKTPVRNEEPVFVVTGRKEDVAKAKREILSAAEHFTLIRATRRTNDSINGCLSGLAGAASGSGGGGGHLMSLNKNSLSMSTPLPGQITIQVRVPYRVVGLVVGPKGNTIKHIQHETQTYIVTPSRDKEPIFEVTGMPENVQMARKQIEAHIAYSLAVPQPAAPPPPPPPPPPAPGGAFERINESLNSNSAFHSLNSLNQMLNDDLHSEILTSIYKNGIGPALEYNNQIAGSSGTLNPVNKCNTANVYNSFASNDLNPSITSVNDLQRRVAINSTNNIQLNCNDFINTLMDSTSSTTPQFANEQNVNFPQLASNNTAIRNLKSVINNINLLENTNTGTTSGLFHEQNKQNALLTRSCSSASSTTSSKSFNNNTNNTSQLWKSLGATNNTCVVNDNIDVDEGIGESPLYSWGLPNTLAALTNSYCSPTSASISPTDSLFSEQNNKTAAANLQQQPLLKITSKTKLLEKLKCKKCWMCHEKDIVATFIPCGHTILCSLCANRLYQQTDANCLVCSTQIYQVIRVH